MCLCAHIIFSSYDNIRILCPCCSMLSYSSLGFFLCGGCSSYYTIDREIIIFFGGASKVWILDNVIDYLERSHVKGDKNMEWKWSQNIMPRCNEHFFILYSTITFCCYTTSLFLRRYYPSLWQEKKFIVISFFISRVLLFSLCLS